ncbi:MAG: proton-conducting transporter membrane subunit [Desulfobulbaceae bacterium]|nr:proton-conducting transporter membrane subunit [Desulfobulbaceae bacterium]
MTAVADILQLTPGNAAPLLLFASLLCLTTTGLLALIIQQRRPLAHLAGMAGGAMGGLLSMAAALIILLGNTEADFPLPWTWAGINVFLHLDCLAAFFLLPLSLLLFCGALYGGRYIDCAREGRRLSWHWLFFNLLAASMIVVLTAGNGLIFLLAWEAMSLSSFFLVVYDFDDEEVRKAGWLYLITTHLGAALLFAFFLKAGSLCATLDFTGFTALRALPLPMAILFFFLLLIGFGAKAGLFPMHVWLPGAHSAAPSHVSAMMSGVMIKVAVYGFLRMLTFLPPLPSWCGILVLGLGMGGALFGIAMAALQDDFKRSLAYSTVENIGLIFLGIGIWMFAVASGHAVVAALALTGALLHIWNHALFKGLLFMGAGSVLHATGTRTLSHLGGLLRRMPWTSSLLLSGSTAIAALPPLNGFISEWFLYMGILTMGQETEGGIAIFFLLLAALLALVGGLVLLAFCRLAGLALLGEPRRPQTAKALESSPLLLAPMLLLSALCLGIGLFPAMALRLMAGPMAVIAGPTAAPPLTILPPLPFAGPWSISCTLLLTLAVVTVFFRHRVHRPGTAIATWGCGFLAPTPAMVYMAGGFSQLAGDTLLNASLLPEVTATPVRGFFPKGAAFSQQSADPVLRHGFAPLFSELARRAYLFRRLQAGQLNVYLFYIFIATTLLLGWVMWQG